MKLADLAQRPALAASMTEVIDGRVQIGGAQFVVNSKGDFMPLANVKASDLLMDELVRKIVGFAEPLSAEVARFREHCFDDCDGMTALLDQDYGVKRGGTKGNMTFRTLDGCMRVTVQVADLIEFGPELQSAKALLDECLLEWSADSRAELQSIIKKAFDVERQGGINRYWLIQLLRVESEDERWNRAMTAVRDSMRTIGSKRYVRIQKRARPDGEWQSIVIDMASA